MPTPNPSSNNDPFSDPAGPDVTPSTSTTGNVLIVDRNVTLSLATDALIVLDEGLRQRRQLSNGCGLLPGLMKTTRAIAFHNVLWVELVNTELVIDYAKITGKRSCVPARIQYTVSDRSLHAHTKSWVKALMDRAYPPQVKRAKRIKVLINPFGGQGYAQKLWTRDVEPIFAAARCVMDVEKTSYKGHAVEISQHMDIEKVDVVACASGDGLPHEVFNGLAKQRNPRRALRKVAVTQIPCGSGNAMSLNVNGTTSCSLAAVAIVKGMKSRLDLVAITQGSEQYYSFLSQAVGIIAESDLGTESLRWMGSFRFTWGVLIRLLGKTVYPAEISLVTETDDKREIRDTFRRTVAEHAAAAAKGLHPTEETDSDTDSHQHTSSNDTTLPTLQYGTINDVLPAAFHTHDDPDLGNFYVGNMVWMSADAPFFPTALPADGRMDCIQIGGRISRLAALRMLTTIENGTIIHAPEVAYAKIKAYRIKPRMAPDPETGRFRAKLVRWLGGGRNFHEGLIAIDGEKVPFTPFQAEVMPGLGTVLSRRVGVYEFEIPEAL